MLRIPTFQSIQNPILLFLSDGKSPSHHPVDGYFWDYSLNPQHALQDPVDSYPEDVRPCSFPPFGVHDTVEAFDQQFGNILRNEPNREFCVAFTTITPQDNPDWRWHKWGEYYGNQNPQCEHIGDEPEIKSVVVFQVLEFI